MFVPGDILSLHIFGQVIIVLSSTKTSKDLLEKRGDIYSDRLVVPFHDMYVIHLFARAFLDMIQDGNSVGVTACEIC